MTRGENTKYLHDLQGLSICFDLDGTLVDTAPDLVRVTNEVIALEGVGPTDYRRTRSLVGLGSRRLIVDALASAGKSVTVARLDELQALFLHLYAEDIAQLSVPFPGVVETLKQLEDLGAELTVCTNKPGYLARSLLHELALTHWFSNIVGGDEARRAKPDPRHIFAAAGHRDAARIAMIGDSITDMRAAHNANVFSVMLPYGYSHIPQKRLRADARLRTFRALTPTLMSWYTGRRSVR